MTTLSIEQVAGVAIAAGLSGEPAAIATAIAWGESNGDTDARGDTTITTSTWGPSIGLWQIRSLNAQRGSGSTRDELANRDAGHNAKAMMELSNGGTNWRPWSVYTSGQYRAHLARARLAVANPSAAPGGSSAATASGAGGINLLDGGTWLRVGLFVFGTVLLLIALWKATGVGGNIVKAIPIVKAVA